MEHGEIMKRRYEVTGLDKIYTSKKEAFRQARSLARASQASIMVYKLEPETKTYQVVDQFEPKELTR